MTEISKQEAKTLSDWAYIAVKKHFNKILKHEDEVIKDRHPEELHQMRVGMRRLRSAIAGFSSALVLPKSASEKKVGQVARVLGELRDLDVLEDAFKTQYKPFLPKSEQQALATAIKVLSKQREKSFQKVKDILNDNLYLNLKEDFQKWLDHPKYKALGDSPIQTVLPDLLLPQVSRFLLHPAWLIGSFIEDHQLKLHHIESHQEVEKLLHLQGDTLHSLRKEAKRTRYNMELFTQFYTELYQVYLEDVKTIQAILGDIQDCFVLAEFLSDVFEDNINQKIPTLLNNLQEKRYQKWNEWRALQHKYLKRDLRKDFHLVILNPDLAEL